jgi:putative transposase
MARPRSIDLRETLVKIFPRRRITELAREAGAFCRRRKVDIADFFWLLVLGFGTGRERTLAGLRRSFEKATGLTLEESSFYKRFNKGLRDLMRMAASEAFASLEGIGRALEGPLAQFRDLVVTDSTVMRLHDLLERTFPACRTNHTKAALKLHAVVSVLGAGGNSLKITDQRTHDGPVFRVGRWVRDRLLVFDLGYFRYQLFDCIDRNGGHFISRLKKSGNPLIVASNLTHRGRAVPVVGRHLLEVVADLKRQALDVTVQVSFKRRQYAGKHSGGRRLLRVVGVKDPASGKYHLYVTNIPTAKLSAAEIAQVYATRWQIELLFKELKSHYRIEDLPSRKREIVEALVYAAVLTLVVSRRLLAAVRAKLRSKRERLPEQRWAQVFAALSQDLLSLALGTSAETRRLERLLTVTMLHEAVDPNAKRRRLLESVETRSHQYTRKAA